MAPPVKRSTREHSVADSRQAPKRAYNAGKQQCVTPKGSLWSTNIGESGQHRPVLTESTTTIPGVSTSTAILGSPSQIEPRETAAHSAAKHRTATAHHNNSTSRTARRKRHRKQRRQQRQQRHQRGGVSPARSSTGFPVSATLGARHRDMLCSITLR